MKKIILSTLLVAMLASCKKEAEKTEGNISSVDSKQIDVPEPVAVNPSIKYLSVKEATDFLQKKNDTLYVTNFFATWCGPCVREIPHFKEKIEELKDKPVKITFVSLDQKAIWNTEVPRFTQEHGIQNHTVLLDGQLLDQNFFVSNFKQWDGGAIPFTFMRKGDKTDETLGMMSKEQLNEKINKLLGSKIDKKIKLDDDYVAGTIGVPEEM